MSWFVIGLFASGVIWWLGSSRWFPQEEQLGSVSSQWLAEYRQNHDS